MQNRGVIVCCLVFMVIGVTIGMTVHQDWAIFFGWGSSLIAIISGLVFAVKMAPTIRHGSHKD